MKNYLKRYWKAVVICLAIVLGIGIGIKGLNIKTVDEYASSKAQVVEEEPDETSSTENQTEENTAKDEEANDKATQQDEKVNKSNEENAEQDDLSKKNVVKTNSSNKIIESNTENPKGVEEQPKKEIQEQQKKSYCTISIDCQTILNNMNDLKENKKPYVPANGYIFSGKVQIKEGQTVMDVLLSLPGVNVVQTSGYVVSINNLKEKDCGRYSGWMYNVNGVYPNYGCAEYKLKDGDNIQWRYTCNLGNDLGAGMN